MRLCGQWRNWCRMMRERKDYVVLTFHTTAEAMKAEKYCMEQNIPGRLIPVPSEISAGCGICWRMPEEDYGYFRERMQELVYERKVRIRM